MATPPRTVCDFPLIIPSPIPYEPPPRVMQPTPPEHYLLEFAASDPGPIMQVRIRRLLKAARRAYHLTCISCYQLPKDGRR